jgi:hypothetical protein
VVVGFTGAEWRPVFSLKHADVRDRIATSYSDAIEEATGVGKAIDREPPTAPRQERPSCNVVSRANLNRRADEVGEVDQVDNEARDLGVASHGKWSVDQAFDRLGQIVQRLALSDHAPTLRTLTPQPDNPLRGQNTSG